jgi:hypothetical protein
MHDQIEAHEPRPLGLTLLTGLYFFFFLVSASTFGNPFPFMGHIHTGTIAKSLVVLDCLICLYLSIGTLKRQYLTWYLLLAYNFFEIMNTIINLNLLTTPEIESALGVHVSQDTMWVNNIAMALVILLLTQFVYRSRRHFTNRQKYLF